MSNNLVKRLGEKLSERLNEALSESLGESYSERFSNKWSDKLDERKYVHGWSRKLQICFMNVSSMLYISFRVLTKALLSHN